MSPDFTHPPLGEGEGGELSWRGERGSGEVGSGEKVS